MKQKDDLLKRAIQKRRNRTQANMDTLYQRNLKEKELQKSEQQWKIRCDALEASLIPKINQLQKLTVNPKKIIRTFFLLNPSLASYTSIASYTRPSSHNRTASYPHQPTLLTPRLYPSSHPSPQPKPSTCLLDPIPTRLLKDVLPLCLQVSRINRSREGQVLLIVVSMVTGYLLCWMPYGVVAMLASFARPGLVTPAASLIPSLLAKTSSVLNPIIYVLLNHQVQLRSSTHPSPPHNAQQQSTVDPRPKRADRGTKRRACHVHIHRTCSRFSSLSWCGSMCNAEVKGHFSSVIS
ncbi:Pinopsin Pineal gland-specific opsin [Collichthys lucidus]|uniref:Pinopsin Pineal gland-specific opsin n=1 Tax=Collichthys lucidus TaxID=240159 RepID=A0A4U5TVV3_COLLU|nr:Pinopsin Pineal gland-specific opsin [Collichthys lucidus]